MDKKIILQVIGGLNRGGAETMLMNIYRNMDDNYKFVFLTYNLNGDIHDYEEEVIKNGDLILKLDSKRVSNPLIFFVDLLKIMNSYKFDCVHSHTLFNSGVVMLVAKICKIPVRVTHSHSSGIMKKNNVINKIYFSFERYLINTFCNVKIACDLNSGYYLFGNSFNGYILNNGIDLNKFNPSTIANYYHEDLIDDNCIKMAAISSFYTVKNHKYIIKIAKKFKKMNVNFKIFFAGRGPLMEELQQYVEDNELKKEIIFLGIVENIHEFLPAIDVILMPSLYEGIPVSLIESQASGTPAIISDKISRDVDLGLGLIKFLPIEEKDINSWVSSILNYHNMHANKETILNTIAKKGYDVKSNIKLICDIYSKI